jgi:hypothetical protein
MGDDWVSRLGYAASKESIKVEERVEHPVYQLLISYVDSLDFKPGSCLTTGHYEKSNSTMEKDLWGSVTRDTGVLPIRAELRWLPFYPAIGLPEPYKLVQSLGVTSKVIFTDFASEEILVSYYYGAECFILPSFYEGFGFSLLEAMACGCLVIVSNVTSLPEITGEVAIKVDPHDMGSIAYALREILANDLLKRELVSRSFEQAGQFGWEKVARETLKVYGSVERSLSIKYVPAEVMAQKEQVS